MTKKQARDYATHQLDIYADVELNLATTRKQWRQMVRDMTFLANDPDLVDVPDGNIGYTSACGWKPDDGTAGTHVLALWVDVRRHRDMPHLVDTIAHEATHAAGEIFRQIGHRVEFTDEPHAYLVAWLARWMLTQVPARRLPKG